MRYILTLILVAAGAVLLAQQPTDPLTPADAPAPAEEPAAKKTGTATEIPDSGEPSDEDKEADTAEEAGEGPEGGTVEEADEVISILEHNDLKRGVNDLNIIMMCEIPSNALLAEQFLQRFDGFSIGSNDLTQLTLGLDRDSGLVAELFDERNDAVKALLTMAIQACRMNNKYIGICGQGPSDHPDLAFWLMEQGINSVSLNPDSVIETWLYLAEHNNEKH